MRTRRGISYPKMDSVDETMSCCEFDESEKTMPCRKRVRMSPVTDSGEVDFLDRLPDDVVLFVLAKLGATAGCPADFVSVLLTCKRLNAIGVHSLVLSRACSRTFGVKPENWSESAHRFLKRCSDAGNVEASYTLGMIRFYCLQNRGSGASLMAKAAISSHAPSLYSLAVIQFNGSGGSKNDKDLRAGVALCARAAFLGHIDALRELGHCLQDGYGVRQNIPEGRRFLVQANARELATVLSTPGALMSCNWLRDDKTGLIVLNRSGISSAATTVGPGCPLLSDFGCNVPPPEPHPANRFLSNWFADKKLGPGLRLCSHAGCGRPETRLHEFRRCSVCGGVNYCSRACQALDWKLRHKMECTQVQRVVDDGEEDNGNVNEDNGMFVDS